MDVLKVFCRVWFCKAIRHTFCLREHAGGQRGCCAVLLQEHFSSQYLRSSLPNIPKDPRASESFPFCWRLCRQSFFSFRCVFVGEEYFQPTSDGVPRVTSQKCLKFFNWSLHRVFVYFFCHSKKIQMSQCKTITDFLVSLGTCRTSMFLCLVVSRN